MERLGRLWRYIVAAAAVGGAIGFAIYMWEGGEAAVSGLDRILGGEEQGSNRSAAGGSGGRFYPAREPYPYEPCTRADAICGSADGPVFNTFGNTPSWGDERSFLDGRLADATEEGSYGDPVELNQGSERVVVRLYVHNNADVETNASGKGIARGTRVRLSIPAGLSRVLRIRGYISADNATPKVVENTLDLTGPQPFRVRFVPGSAVMYNNGWAKTGRRLSDELVRPEGALIGSDALDGRVPGGFDEEIVVQAQVQILPVPA